MIIYFPDPQQLINSMESREVVQIKLPSGGYVNAEPLAYNQVRIIEVVSTDPMDYMHDKYQPGNIVTHEL
jgi:hypothetical protein